MKRLTLAFLLMTGLFVMNPLSVNAVSVPGPGPSSGGGSGGTAVSTPAKTPHYHEVTFPDGKTGTIECYHEDCEFDTFTPKVTGLHSVNAIVASSDEYNGVYYLPELEDIPIDLVSVCSDVKLAGDAESRHSFAYVYDGYYNAEVQLEQPKYEGYKVGTAQTSKRVWSSTDSSRLLNIVGYDMLLQSEYYSLKYNPATGDIDITYSPSLVGSSPLTANILVMDIYKALGQFEYDFDISWGKDPQTFGWSQKSRIDGMSESPLLQGITYMVNDVDVSEVKTYIAVTRTNPQLYWNRFLRDGVCNGGKHTLTSNAGEIGSEVSVSQIYNSNSLLTGAEFCNLLRALMVLYGEKVPTEYELICAEQAYSIQFPRGRYTEEVYDSIMYLIAKGIVNPDEFDFDSQVTFADIEYTLLRVADEDSRIETIEYYNAKNPLADKGYAMANTVTILDDKVDIMVMDKSASSKFDILVQVVPGVNTMPVTTKDLEEFDWGEEGFSYSQGSGSITGSPDYDVTLVGINDNNCLLGVKKLVIPGHDELVSFYHFKAGPGDLDNSDKAELYLTTSIHNETAPWNYDNPIKLYDSYEGGVWLLDEDGSFKHYTFADMNCSNDFIDTSSMKVTGQLAASSKVVIVLTPASYITSDFLSEVSSQDNLNYAGISSPGMHNIGNNITCSTIDYPADGIDYMRFEFTCPEDAGPILNSKFLSQLNNYKGSSSVIEDTVVGYYRSSTNTLMVSVDYLKDSGALTGYKKLANDKGYILLNSNYGVNVTLSNDFGYIMVGNTLYPKDGEDLYYLDGDTLYVNYKACVGWTGDVLVLPGNKDKVVVQPIAAYGQTTGVRQYVSYKTLDVRTFYPFASTSVLELATYPNSYHSKETAKGLSLSGNYALSPYLLVMANDNGKDYLFVYHRRNMSVEGSIVDEEAQNGDSASRDKFASLTGITLDSSDDFYLVMYELNRDGTNLPTGIKLLTNDSNNKYTEGVTSTLGYVYEVPECDSVIEAINEYAKGNSMLHPLPIVKYKFNSLSDRYFDLNVNTFKKDMSSEMEDVGKLPYCLASSTTNASVVSIINASGNYTRLSDETADLNNIIICAAPAGIWGQLQLIGQEKLADIKTSTCAMYYGTQFATKNEGGIVIQNRRTNVDTNSVAFCTYFGSYGSSVYVSYATESTIGSIIDLQSVEDNVEAVIEDPLATIDWAQYKFTRLMEDADKFSTILLIFILNILPRVAMLVFFVIILLALIKDVKPWKKFNQRFFDVYKFLSLGHISVDTINYKRVLFTSMIALALFFMIMDGTLWNVFMWCVKAILHLQQH